MRIIPPTIETTTEEETIDLSRGCIVFDAANWPFTQRPQLLVDQWGVDGGVIGGAFFVPGEGFAWTTKGRLISLTEMAVNMHFGDAE